MVKGNFSQVSVEVATNTFNLWAQQLKEKEEILQKQLLEVNLLKERFSFLLIFLIFFFFLFFLLNFYFYFQLKNKTLKVSNPKKKLIFEKNYSLKDFGKRIIKFSQKIKKDKETKIFSVYLQKLGEVLANDFSKISFFSSLEKLKNCKKILKKIRYNLNKVFQIKKEPSLKKETRSLWKETHKLSLFLSSVIKEREKFKF